MSKPTPTKTAAVFRFKPRDADDTPEVALPRLPKVSTPSPVPPSERTALDLTGKPKVWFVIGRGGTGKTTLVRWAAEMVDRTDGQMLCVAADPMNRSLRMFRQDVLEPPANDPGAVATWMQELLLHCMREKASALVDLGGGDTSLHRLLATVPDLVDVMAEGGVAPVAIHVIGSGNPHDLVTLAETEDAAFQPPATALVCNERMDSRDQFGPVLRHSVFRAAVERGAVPLWMPYLTRDTARLVESRHMPFMSVGNTLGPFNGAAVRMWLRTMEQEFKPILDQGWLPQ